MCLAIPMQVISAHGTVAMCQGPDGPERIDTLLVGDVQAGQWLLVFLGSARECIDAARAAQVTDALAALQAGLAAGDPQSVREFVDARFPDLAGREPQLPDFLRPPARRA